MNQDHKTTPVEQDQVATPTSQAQNAGQGHQEARRRLLKAAAVAPVIYTLPSGGALAAGSSCVDNNDGTNVILGPGEEEFNEHGELIGRSINGQFYELSSGNEYLKDGQIYKFDDVDMFTASCWNSVKVVGTASTKAIDRIA